MEDVCENERKVKFEGKCLNKWMEKWLNVRKDKIEEF